jgi:hypothetical protein
MNVTAPQPGERVWKVSQAPAMTAIRNKIADTPMPLNYPGW